MFVDPIRGRSQGLVLAAAAVFAGGACSDPEQNTDLRPSGDPEVLAVLVANDAVSYLYESATFCKLNDEKRPTQVGLPDFTLAQICDADPSVGADPVTDAYPDGWYVRIMFDELLDTDIEELTEILDENGQGTDTFTGSIANTQPVLLECESVGGGFVEVSYDGYYSPAGNRETWPLGPSLVVKPNDPTEIATGKRCRITINDNVVDKSGNPVPADQRGPYEFQLATIQPIFTSPADGDEIAPLAVWWDNVYIQFNTTIQDDSWCDGPDGECEFTFGPELDAEGLYAYSIEEIAKDDEFGFGPNAIAAPGGTYTFAFKEGATVRDRCGQEVAFGAPSAAAGTSITFTTSAFELNRTRPANGDTAAPLRRFVLEMTNVVDRTSLEASEYSITPAPESPGTLGTSTGGDIIFRGFYKPSTMYTFTLNPGATIADATGAVYTQGAEALTVTWTTQAIALTSTLPANNGTSVKGDTTEPTQIAINFNTAMDPASLGSDEFTVTGPGGTAVPFSVVGGSSGCGATGTSTTCSIVLESDAALAPGDYIFTLSAGATLTDRMTEPTTYTQAADRVVNFTVEEAGPPAPEHVCL